MDDDEGEAFPARPAQPLDFAVIGLSFLRDLSGAVESALDLTVQVVGGHVNWNVEQREFRREAALEIESLTNGEVSEES